MDSDSDPFRVPWTREARTGHRLATIDGVDLACAAPDGAAPVRGWPTIVVTDAALHFDAFAAAAAVLAGRPAKTGVGRATVVGIASGAGWSHDAGRRGRDLVPGDDGAAGALLATIVDRVLPAVARVAPVDRGALSIVGHSLGGLFALHALATRPDIFARAVAISPSLWRHPGQGDIIAPYGKAGRLMILSGACEDRINADLLGAGVPGDAPWRAILADEDHGSTVFAGLPRALRFVSPSAIDNASQ